LKKYCIDTCSLIHLANFYPIDVFPPLWDKMNDLIIQSSLFISSEVFEELKTKDDELFSWIKTKTNMIIEINEPIQLAVIDIIQKYPKLVDIETGNSKADPFIIATAKAQNPFFTVITEENPFSPKKIPSICKQENVRCINLVNLMREQGWVFRV
jgi:hypothetical protein